MDNFEKQTQVSTKQFRYHHTLVLMKMDLIYKLGRDNVMLDMLIGPKEFQTINTI